MLHLSINSIQLVIVLFSIVVVQRPIGVPVLQVSTGTPTSGPTSQTPVSTPGTPPSSETAIATVIRTPTHTLVPLPEITLIFPASTATPTATITPHESLTLPTDSPSAGGDALSIPPRLRVLSIILVILWILLAGYLIIYIKQVL